MSKIIDLRNEVPKRAARRSKSDIKKIAVHYSATKQGNFWSFWNNTWSKKNPPWQTGGYAEIVLSDEDNNDVELCYDYDMVTNGVGGHNSTTFHICGVNDGPFSPGQKKVLFERISFHLRNLNLSVNDVFGHNEFTNQRTSCPGNDMDQFRKELKEYIESGKIPGGVDPAPIDPSPTKRVLRIGNRGMKAAILQRKLLALGYNLPRFRDDGIFGMETQNAVRAFQKERGIAVDGIVGPKTGVELEKVLPRNTRLLRIENPMLKGNDVKAVQRVVNVTSDGIYGPKTEKAVKAYQKKHKLTVDGIVGPATWVHMFGK